MPIALLISWHGVTRDRYDAVRNLVDWEGNIPERELAHLATVDLDGMRIVDLWETEEAFDAFLENRLKPAVERLGIAIASDVRQLPVHAIFAPGFEPPRT